jgi:hypothetical protein
MQYDNHNSHKGRFFRFNFELFLGSHSAKGSDVSFERGMQLNQCNSGSGEVSIRMDQISGGSKT